MLDHKIIIRKPDQVNGIIALYEQDQHQAEIEADKFRRGEFYSDLLKVGYIVEVRSYDTTTD